MAKRKIACKTEVLEYLTGVMRSGIDEGKKADATTTKAAELIGKHLGMFSDKSGAEQGVNVVIVDDIGREE